MSITGTLNLVGSEGGPVQPVRQAAIILTNFRRPGNVMKQLEDYRGLAHMFDLFVIDNAPVSTNLRSYYAVEPWFHYIENGLNLGPGHRFLFSCSLPHRYLIAVDDDVFLTPAQLLVLYESMRQQPTRVHGVWGQILDPLFQRRKLKGGIRSSRAVDVISRVYGYTPEIALSCICLARYLGFRAWTEIGPTDDILLSVAGAEPPLCHATDELKVCDTSDLVGIALWRTEGFYPARNSLIDRLLQRGLFAPYHTVPS
jgi:hypothetical protein